MSLAADALQPSVVNALFTLNGRTALCNLPDVITSGQGAGFDLDFDGASLTVGLDFREPSYIGATIGGDALRFAGAAFTSVRGIGSAIEDRSTIAWALIRLYYAAFYAGHGLLRVLGQSCSYLDTSHVNRLVQLATAQGIATFPLSRGVYRCEINQAQTGMTLLKVGGASGGAHETFWDVFSQFLGETTEEVLLGHLVPADARSVFVKLETYRSILRPPNGGAPSWLSHVRNDIQYRQGQGVWVPGTVNKTKRALLARLAQQWARDPMAVDVEMAGARSLKHFVIACAFTLSLCRAVLARINERSSAAAPKFAAEVLALV